VEWELSYHFDRLAEYVSEYRLALRAGGHCPLSWPYNTIHPRSSILEGDDLREGLSHVGKLHGLRDGG